jgi:hypothetical protein
MAQIAGHVRHPSGAHIVVLCASAMEDRVEGSNLSADPQDPNNPPGLMIEAVVLLRDSEFGLLTRNRFRQRDRKCDHFGIPSTSHWTGAAIIVQ